MVWLENPGDWGGERGAINGRREIWTVVEQVCAKMSLGVPVSLECRSSMERTRVVGFSGRRGISN